MILEFLEIDSIEGLNSLFVEDKYDTDISLVLPPRMWDRRI